MTLQSQAKAPPAIPGLEQGNPQVSNRQAGQPATPPPTPPAAPGQPVFTTGPGGRAETADQLRERIRNEIQQSIQGGRDPQFNLPDRFDARDAVPVGAVQISIALFASLAFVIVFLPVARAVVRRSDAQNQRLASGAGEIGPRLEQLQQSVDGLAVEIERITEAQRFQAKLLAERVKEPERIGG